MREIALDAYVRRTLPFDRVLEEICSRPAVRADVAFTYLTVNRRPSRGPGFDVTGYRQRLNSNSLLVSISIVIVRDVRHIRLGFVV